MNGRRLGNDGARSERTGSRRDCGDRHRRLGPRWLSDALLIVAVAGLAVLTMALVWWLAVFRSSVAADLRAPERVFGFFTITAGLDVLGVRFAAAGHPLPAAVLAGPAAILWLLLTYGVPASLLLARQRDSVLGGVNGSWLRGW